MTNNCKNKFHSFHQPSPQLILKQYESLSHSRVSSPLNRHKYIYSGEKQQSLMSTQQNFKSKLSDFIKQNESHAMNATRYALSLKKQALQKSRSKKQHSFFQKKTNQENNSHKKSIKQYISNLSLKRRTKTQWNHEQKNIAEVQTAKKSKSILIIYKIDKRRKNSFSNAKQMQWKTSNIPIHNTRLYFVKNRPLKTQVFNSPPKQVNLQEKQKQKMSISQLINLKKSLKNIQQNIFEKNNYNHLIERNLISLKIQKIHPLDINLSPNQQKKRKNFHVKQKSKHKQSYEAEIGPWVKKNTFQQSAQYLYN